MPCIVCSSNSAFILSWNQMVDLSLSNNRFSGPIPRELGELPVTHCIDLSRILIVQLINYRSQARVKKCTGLLQLRSTITIYGSRCPLCGYTTQRTCGQHQNLTGSQLVKFLQIHHQSRDYVFDVFLSLFYGVYNLWISVQIVKIL